MSPLKVLASCLIGGALVTVAVQKNAISKVRQENETARQTAEEAAQLGRENGSIPQLRAENPEMEALQKSNRDLLKVRNEVRQLREQIPELEKLRLENHGLASEIKQ